MPKRRPLTPDELADANRLRAAYDDLKAVYRARGEKINQEEIAAQLQITQSAFSQYSRGAMPLNVQLLTALHEKFGLIPHEISPHLAADMARVSEASGLDFDKHHHKVPMVDARMSAKSGSIVRSTDEKQALAFRKDFLADVVSNLDDVVAFPVSGNSMDQVHIIDGSVVLLDTSAKGQELVSEKFYGVWIDHEVFVKQMIKRANGTWCAVSHSLHEDHPDNEIDRESGVVGRAFWVGFKL